MDRWPLVLTDHGHDSLTDTQRKRNIMQTNLANRPLPSASGLMLDRDVIEHLISILPFLSWQDAPLANGVLLGYHCTGSLNEGQRATLRELAAKVGRSTGHNGIC